MVIAGGMLIIDFQNSFNFEHQVNNILKNDLDLFIYLAFYDFPNWNLRGPAEKADIKKADKKKGRHPKSRQYKKADTRKGRHTKRPTHEKADKLKKGRHVKKADT